MPADWGTMPKKTPPDRDIERIRRSLAGTEEGDSADICWARQILLGDDAPPPGDALRPEVAYALVEELIERQDADTLARLAQSHHRSVAKAARTGLHRMRSHRVAVEVPVEAEPHEGTGAAGQQSIRSMATIYDSRWERLVWVATDSPSGLRIHQGRLSALFGLVELHSAAATRKEYRAKTREILEELGGEMVDPDHGRWLIHDAARRREAHGRSLPRGYVLAARSLGSAPEGGHPALSMAPERGAVKEQQQGERAGRRPRLPAQPLAADGGGQDEQAGAERGAAAPAAGRHRGPVRGRLLHPAALRGLPHAAARRCAPASDARSGA